MWMALASVALEDGRWTLQTATANEEAIRSRIQQGSPSRTLLELTHPQEVQQGLRDIEEWSPQEEFKEEEEHPQRDLLRQRRLLRQVPQEQEQEAQSRRQGLKREPGFREISQPWLQEHFPRPDSDACRSTKSHRICDPDGVLSTTGLARLDEYLDQKQYVYRPLCEPNAAAGGDNNDREKMEGLEIQMAVALVKEVCI
jgi:hypothetical protein